MIDLMAARGGQTLNCYDPMISTTTPMLRTHANPTLYMLTGGPQFRIRYHSRVQPIARVLYAGVIALLIASFAGLAFIFSLHGNLATAIVLLPDFREVPMC